MTIYVGVVSNGTVKLPDEAHLANGTLVQVQPIGGVDETSSADARLQRLLLDRGLISEILPLPARSVESAQPRVRLSGRPLSEDIIRDRR